MNLSYNKRMLRKWLSFVVMLAFVITTVPTLSHASMAADTGHKTVKVAQAKKHHHCCPEMTKKDEAKKTASHDKHCPMHTKSCCDAGFCKCVGGSCTAAKILGSNSIIAPFVTRKTTFTVSQDRLSSSLSERIKRPPKA